MFFHQLWGHTPDGIRQLFENSVKPLQVDRAQRIYGQGDTPQGIYFIKKGLVGLVLVGASSGREHLVRFFREGQFFGHRSLFSEEAHHARATALESTELYFLPKDVIEKAFEMHPRLYKEIVSVLAKELRRAEVQRVMILENQVLSRAAQAVVYLKDLHPEHQWTRQEIANFCASTTPSIIKALGKLEQMGLISQNKRTIEVLDRSGLIELDESETI